MPPADNNTPVPQPPKQGFFAKLFGKKPKETTAPIEQPRESLTPPPQLDDPTSPDPTAAPTAGTDLTSPNGVESAPDLGQPVPTVAPDQEPQTLDVPPAVNAEPTEETGVPPTLPTQPPADGGQPFQAPSGEAPEDPTQTPQQ